MPKYLYYSEIEDIDDKNGHICHLHFKLVTNVSCRQHQYSTRKRVNFGFGKMDQK